MMPIARNNKSARMLKNVFFNPASKEDMTIS
jgi:hypothetical protein